MTQKIFGTLFIALLLSQVSSQAADDCTLVASPAKSSDSSYKEVWKCPGLGEVIYTEDKVNSTAEVKINVHGIPFDSHQTIIKYPNGRPTKATIVQDLQDRLDALTKSNQASHDKDVADKQAGKRGVAVQSFTKVDFARTALLKKFQATDTTSIFNEGTPRLVKAPPVALAGTPVDLGVSPNSGTPVDLAVKPNPVVADASGAGTRRKKRIPNSTSTSQTGDTVDLAAGNTAAAASASGGGKPGTPGTPGGAGAAPAPTGGSTTAGAGGSSSSSSTTSSSVGGNNSAGGTPGAGSPGAPPSGATSGTTTSTAGGGGAGSAGGASNVPSGAGGATLPQVTVPAPVLKAAETSGVDSLVKLAADWKVSDKQQADLQAVLTDNKCADVKPDTSLGNAKDTEDAIRIKKCQEALAARAQAFESNIKSRQALIDGTQALKVSQQYINCTPGTLAHWSAQDQKELSQKGTKAVSVCGKSGGYIFSCYGEAKCEYKVPHQLTFEFSVNVACGAATAAGCGDTTLCLKQSGMVEEGSVLQRGSDYYSSQSGVYLGDTDKVSDPAKTK